MKRNLAGERKDGTVFIRDLKRRRSTSDRTTPSTIMTSVWLVRAAYSQLLAQGIEGLVDRGCRL